MYTKLTAYPSPPPLRSNLLRNTPEVLPPVSELKLLENELQTLRAKLKERGRKAGADIKVIEESMRRMKEGEKGKAKAVEKVKRERDCTCILPLRVSSNLTWLCHTPPLSDISCNFLLSSLAIISLCETLCMVFCRRSLPQTIGATMDHQSPPCPTQNPPFLSLENHVYHLIPLTPAPRPPAPLLTHEGEAFLMLCLLPANSSSMVEDRKKKKRKRDYEDSDLDPGMSLVPICHST